MTSHRLGVAALVAASFAASSVATLAQAADHLLSGTIASSTGEKLGGVTVSAKPQGSTITTSVYTDEQGAYYFPPLPAGKYSVWAQALAFETAKGEVDLTAARRADLDARADDRSRAPGASAAGRDADGGAARGDARTTPASNGSSATTAPAATPRATCCSSASTRTAGTRSSI